MNPVRSCSCQMTQDTWKCLSTHPRTLTLLEVFQILMFYTDMQQVVFFLFESCTCRLKSKMVKLREKADSFFLSLSQHHYYSVSIRYMRRKGRIWDSPDVDVYFHWKQTDRVVGLCPPLAPGDCISLHGFACFISYSIQIFTWARKTTHRNCYIFVFPLRKAVFCSTGKLTVLGMQLTRLVRQAQANINLGLF